MIIYPSPQNLINPLEEEETSSHDPLTNISNIYSSNSETSASELLQNLEEMFPQYYLNSDVINRFKIFTHLCVVHRCGINHMKTVTYTIMWLKI